MRLVQLVECMLLCQENVKMMLGSFRRRNANHCHQRGEDVVEEERMNVEEEIQKIEEETVLVLSSPMVITLRPPPPQPVAATS